MLACATASAETWTYWIQPCTGALASESGCEPADSELGAWALDAWRKASNGALKILAASDERNARLRIYWASGRMHLYGETRPLEVDGRRGAAIYVLPDLAGLGGDIAVAGKNDKLFRDSIVYLTCLHESGHALGLPHTADFADIMYTFQFGGDIVEYFARYRRALTRRTDIANASGISPRDRQALKAAMQ
ncbi:MAG: hypothetical protein M3Z23_02615 [Acidobacteriota bacterium]|nr:hypothetical protein [Acidobacteriota bacterium]